MLAAALVLLASQEPTLPVLPDTSLARVGPACVQIRSYGKTMSAGSGFVFGARNVIVTSARVVAGGARNVVIDGEGNAHRARGLVKDTANDLAIIVLDDEVDCTPFEATAEAAEGASAFLVGYPVGRSKLSVARGTMRVAADRATFTLGTPIESGASGAPVIGVQGELLGMASRNEAGGGVVVRATFAMSAARRAAASDNVSATTGAGPGLPTGTVDEGGDIDDDPTDAIGEFAPSRVAIENARRKEGSVPSVPPTIPSSTPVKAEVPKQPEATAETKVDPRIATSLAFARFWGGLFERKARWYVATEADAIKRQEELLAFARDPIHRRALTESGPFEPSEWDKVLIVLESEVEEIATDRSNPTRLMAADDRLVTRLRRRLWTAELTSHLDTDVFSREVAPSAASASLLARFRAIADPRTAAAVIAISADAELRAGDEITALVLDGGTPIPVRSLGELAVGEAPAARSIVLVVRRGDRTVVVGEPALRAAR